MKGEKKRALLEEYSQWLDYPQELMKKPKKDDGRSHEDLVNQFLAERETS